MPLLSTHFVFLSLFSTAFSLFGYTQQGGKTRLLGNSFGAPNVNATYDYVVVGGGTAGLTIATRLAENPALSVAVIEAGGFYEMESGNTSQVPGYGSSLLSFNDLVPSHSLVDWDLITEPQVGLNGRRIHYGAGKTLGGSSALNDMIFHRGTVGSYQQWADLVGDQSYTYENLLPYFQKSAAFTPPNLQKIGINESISYDPTAFSNEGGPLQLSYSNYRQPFASHIETAFSKIGLNSTAGFNSGSLDGYASATLVLDPTSQTRSSSEASFLQKALDSSALKLYIHTQAKQIQFDGNKVATSVIVETNGVDYVISASKEIILSAGVFHSPQLLQLSGVGPADLLESHGIPVISDLPGVGQNMLDQVFIFTSHEVNLTTNSAVLADPVLHADATSTYLASQNGPLASVGGEVVGWEKFPNRTAFSSSALSELSTLASDWPEVEYLALSTGSQPADQPLANNYMSFTGALGAAFSFGYVNISSANISDAPIINPNLLSSTTEQELAIQAIKRIRQIAEATGVQVAENTPGSAVTTDAEILEWVRNNAVNGYHASSTCRMGKKGDPKAVIDTNAKVFGVQGLRVVDASAFPLLPPGHPMSSIYALAEKTAADILSS